MKYRLLVKKYKQHGDIAWEYNALRNVKEMDGTIKNFRVDNKYFKLNLENPVDIECQPSYDGTVNLILNDDVNPPRIINTRWTRTENNTYKIINREQVNQSNLYREEFLDRETRLFRNINGVTKIDLYNVSNFGRLKAGNYIIYMKYMDDDYNETDIIAQTGTISIFNGTFSSPETVSGGLMDEETNKAILLKLRDLDTSFTYFKLYVYRTTCDANGIKLDCAYKINTDYEITNSSDIIYINGFEEYTDISVEELNIQYNIVDSVKTQAQVQNMLFFANVSKPKDKDADLQNMSLYIKAEEVVSDESIGFIEPRTYKKQTKDDAWQVEYYSPINIYYKLGYWPDEIYRFGIVYIYNDDHLSPVYNLRGCKFTKDKNVNYDYKDEYGIYGLKEDEQKIPSSTEWINETKYINTKGIFKFSDRYADIVKSEGDKGIYPLGIKFSFPRAVIRDLRDKNVKGFFFVRQPRIPNIICQGYSVGVDSVGYYPMLKTDSDEEKGNIYTVESFKDETGILTTGVESRLLTTNKTQSSGLLCVDAYVNKQLQSMFDTSEFKLEKIFTPEKLENRKFRHYYQSGKINVDNREQSFASLIYIDPEIPQKIHKDKGFSTKAGMQEDLKYSAPFELSDTTSKDAKLVRGIFTGFIGTTQKLNDGSIYNVRIKNYDESFLKEYFEIRMNDNSAYYAISERFCVSPKEDATDYKYFGDLEGDDNKWIDIPTVFRGDCFTNTVTTRMHRNFTSSSVPINDTIIDEQTWRENFNGLRYTTDWNKINKADVDAVPIGSWMTYKCFSNYNLSLRCIDPFQVEEQALMGNPRSFYPLQDISLKSSNKIPESNLMNDGYNSMLGVKRSFTFDLVPYTKDEFDTRIMFSNIQVDGAFKNSYKVFQGLSYEDIDRQYGSITKILPWGVNLFCVFEHGIAIIPVNEKALLQTTEGLNIHMYGTGVLQKQVVLISDSLGSIWKDSIIKTPYGIYGVDTENHKIWRYSDKYKLEVISDFKMQRYLHDNIDLKELEKYTILGMRNVKTHYNAFKGDVMFTYYNRDRIWNICYNENLGKWITRYSWTPYMSANIDYSMFSFDLLRTRVFGLLNENLGRSQNNELKVKYSYWNNDKCKPGKFYKDVNQVDVNIEINKPYTSYNVNKLVLKGFYWDKVHQRVKYDILHENTDLYKDEVHYDNDWIMYNVYNIIPSDPYDKEDDDKMLEIESEMYNKWVVNRDSGKDLDIIIKPWMSVTDPKDHKYLYFNLELDYTPFSTAEVKGEINTHIANTKDSGTNVFVLSNETKSYTIGLIREYDPDSQYTDDYKNALISSIFVHGRSINADEINYFDNNMSNQCLPTKWYDSQEPFEFEVVVNEPRGLHKIFDNLILVSNNVEPESLEVEITGDVYGFNKAGVFKKEENPFENIEFIPAKNVIGNTDDEGNVINDRLRKEVNTRVHWDPIENSYSLAVHQDMINIKDYGRRLGNIYYNEDKWYVTLKPIYFKEGDSLRSTKIRDKYARIRVKYSGEKLAIIVALQTMFTISYA